MTLFDISGYVTLILFFVFVLLWTSYNSFVKSRTQVEEDFADIDVQLKRRSDLISQLVEVVKGYAKHEEKVFEQVTQLRTQNINSQSVAEIAKRENQTTSLIGSLFAIAENYPVLKADKSYQSLMDNMKETENRIAFFRGEYNISVKKYNSKLQTFPNSIINSLFGFKIAEFFSFK